MRDTKGFVIATSFPVSAPREGVYGTAVVGAPLPDVGCYIHILTCLF